MELYVGGTIYTMQQEGDVVEAVLVNDGIIQQVGTYEALAPLASTVIPLNGATMLPGLVDSHVHLIGIGEQMTRVQLGDAHTVDDIIARLTKAASTLAPGEWLIAEGWNEFTLPNAHMLTLAQLDAVTTNPVILHRVCHHVALVNSTVLQLANITAQTAVAGGTIGCDAQGVVNGLLYEEAVQLATACMPTSGEAYVNHLTASLTRAIRYLHSFGIVGAHSEDCAYYGHYHNVIEAYRRTIGVEKHFRAHLLRHHRVFADMVDAQLQPVPQFIEFGAMKIFADGSFGGSTAALLEPYEGEPTNRGLLVHNRAQFEAFVQLARSHNEAIAVHMIGDAAATLVVEMIERYPTPKGKRDRLIHACLVNEQLIQRMKKLRVIIDIQPAFVPSDYPWIEQKLGKHRMRYAYAWKSLSALPCAIGTDAPIEHIHPFATIAAAVERQRYGDNTYDESLSVFEAVRMYTVGSAYAIDKAHERGMIAPHYTADFTIIDRDIMRIPSSEFTAIRVLRTVVSGQTVYEHK